MPDRRRTRKERAKNQGFGLRARSWAPPVLLAVIALFAVAIAYASAPLSFNAVNNESNALFENPWTFRVDDGAPQEVTLPSSEDISAKSHLTLENTLPDKLVKGATILLRTSQQNVVVAVDGTIIYDSLSETGLPSGAYHFVRLPTDAAAKSITVTLDSPYERYAGMMSQIYIGAKASHIFFLLQQQGLRFMIGFLVLTIGFLVMVGFLIARRRKSALSLIYLGAFFTCAGFWLIVESKLVQFLIPYPLVLTNASIFALSLLPVFSGLYYYSTHAHSFRRGGRYVIALAAVASTLLALAACFFPEIPLTILPLYVAFMGLYVLAVFFSSVVESIRARTVLSLPIIGIVLFSICCLLELTSYLSDTRGYNNSTYLTVGLLIFCVLMITDTIRTFTKTQQAALEAEALAVLAYTDSLTGLKNRTAFLEQIAAFKTDGRKQITLAMFDLNNLKIVNDTHGHLAGDALLRHSVKCIQQSLRKNDELFRVGGDEFVAILIHEYPLDYTTLQDRLEAIVAKENTEPLDYHLSIAYGLATFSDTIDKTLLETLRRADEAMYSCKARQKSAPDNPAE